MDARLRVKQPNPSISVLGEVKAEGAGAGRAVQFGETPRPSIGLVASRIKQFLELSHGELKNPNV